jgi:chemotaxis protein methyltransferase CheR
VTAGLNSSLLPHLEEADYARFRALAHALTGMEFGAHRRPELERAVGETSYATGVTNLGSLYDLLRQAPVHDLACVTFVRHLSVGETHFFRNEPQFTALTQHILPELIERKRHLRQLRIWSAGCSTGEEPYSLAILLEQLLPDLADWSVLLLATDINQEALARAQHGVYGAWSFRQAPPTFQANYFTQEGRTFTLLPRIRQRVTFAYLNLAGDDYPSLPTNTTHMDLILCRNVLIYFSPATTHHVVNRLHAALNEDGWLIVGHAEPSQEVFHQFSICNFPDTVVYRKAPLLKISQAPATPTLPVPQQPMMPAPLHYSPPVVAPQPVRPVVAAPPNADDRYAAALSLAAAGEYEQASQQLLALAAPPVNDGCAAYHLAQLLAGRGELADAERWAQVAVERMPLLAEAHYLHSLLLSEAGQQEAALTALRRCIYVDAEFELAHFALAALYCQQRQAARALRELHLTVTLLAGRPESELLRGSEGLSVGRLRQLATMQASALSAAA